MARETSAASLNQTSFDARSGKAASNAAHLNTGNRGYLTNRGSLSARAQQRNLEPRRVATRRIHIHFSHKPFAITTIDVPFRLASPTPRRRSLARTHGLRCLVLEPVDRSLTCERKALGEHMPFGCAPSIEHRVGVVEMCEYDLSRAPESRLQVSHGVRNEWVGQVL